MASNSSKKTRQRIASYYHIQMPIRLVRLMQKSGYDSGLFLDRFCKFPNLLRIGGSAGTFKKRERLLIIFLYYAWLVYILAGLLVLLQTLLLGIVFLALTPLLIAGLLCVIAFVYSFYRNPSLKHILGFTLSELKPNSKPKKQR